MKRRALLLLLVPLSTVARAESTPTGEAAAPAPMLDNEKMPDATGTVFEHFSARLSLSGMLLTESGNGADQNSQQSLSSLGYGDVRAVIEGRQLPAGLELKADFRLRLTGDLDETAAIHGESQTTARGYAGGREYDLRELYLMRRGERFDVAVGRLIVREADATTLDGARLWLRPGGGAWSLSAYGGLYPNPFSRSIFDDYSSAGIAGGGGLDVAYNYPRLWGWFSGTGLYLGGPDDGGPINPANPAPPADHTEGVRAFLSWTNYLRILDGPRASLDFYHDLVVDVASSAGPQLTRLDAAAHAQFGRFRLDAGYAHLSSLAIEMYLAELLRRYDRTGFLAGTIQNNLIIQRTARDEGRLRADVRLSRLDIYGEARLRRRALIDPTQDPNFTQMNVPDDPALAWDITAGARDDGDLLGLRLAAAFTEITDYRAETQLIDLGVGRDFWDERLGIDLAGGWEHDRDFGADAGATCPAPAPSTLSAGCYGHRTGSVIQGGITVTVRPAARWFILFDYRLVADTADAPASAMGMAAAPPTILTHIVYGRLELRL